MTENFIKPKVFVSKCLGFDRCRWNGETITDDFVDSLKNFVDFVTVCPEVEIGLGVPRDPIRIVFKNKSYSLMQLNTGKDVTPDMKAFSERFLGSLKDIDGFILKDRSPSCGIKDVKVYPGLEKSGVIQKGSGFFAQAVLERFPNLPAESEARLTNAVLREHFLTRIFTIAYFRSIKSGLMMKQLVEFHTRNKFLLMGYSQKELTAMGRITANPDKKKIETVFAEYGLRLHAAIAKPPKYTQSVNVMMHAFGYFSPKLTPDEKKFFLNTMEEYRREQAPLSVPVKLLRSYIVRFNEPYLFMQTFFNPYPSGLSDVRDSSNRRALDR